MKLDMPPSLAPFHHSSTSIRRRSGLAKVSARLVSANDSELAETEGRRGAAIAVVIANRLQLRILESGGIRDIAVHIVLGIDCDGAKTILGIGGPTALHAELGGIHARTAFAAVADTLEMSDTLRDVFGPLSVQTSIAALVRQCVVQASGGQRPALSAALRSVYRAPDIAAARAALDRFALSRWGQRYPSIVTAWNRNWTGLSAYFEFPPAVRRFLETADAVESFFEKLRRRAIALPNAFPSEEAALRTLQSHGRRLSSGWKVAPRKWQPAKAHFQALLAGQERFR